jgi:hypothetical protein
LRTDKNSNTGSGAFECFANDSDALLLACGQSVAVGGSKIRETCAIGDLNFLVDTMQMHFYGTF